MSGGTVELDAIRRGVTAVPKPLLRQVTLLVPMVLDLVILAVRGDLMSAGRFYATGLAVVVLATLVAVVASSDRAGRGAAGPGPAWLFPVWSVPMLDLVAIGLMRLVPDGNGVGVLAVLPAMWLAADRRMRGVGVALVATFLLFSAPSLLYFGTDTPWWSRALLVPMLATMCAMTVAGTAEVWARQSGELERQGRQLEEALEEVVANRALNDAIVSTVDVGLVALDRSGAYRSVNPRQQELMQLSHPDGHGGVAGQPGFVYAADRVTPLSSAEQPEVRALNGEVFSDYVVWVGREPARQKALSVSAGPVVDAAGAFDGAVLAYNDITELMAALSVKDQFVASVSHELRTPLTSILGFLELVLADESIAPAVRRQLQVIMRNSQRLLGLVGDLLLTAQAHEGKLPLNLSETDLAATVEEAVADMAPRVAEAGLTVRTDLDPRAPLAADSARLRQAVDNLLNNAVKYTPPGGRVTVRAQVHGEEVVLAVSDTGIGIPAADLDRLFIPFFRGSEAESQAIQGIGLGLSITQAIVEAHDGRIEVDSEVGVGSTFRIHLPRHRPRGAATAVLHGGGAEWNGALLP